MKNRIFVEQMKSAYLSAFEIEFAYLRRESKKNDWSVSWCWIEKGFEDSEPGKLWNAYYTMLNYDFIARDDWERFYDECKCWTIDNIGIVDSRTGEYIKEIVKTDKALLMSR